MEHWKGKKNVLKAWAVTENLKMNGEIIKARQETKKAYREFKVMLCNVPTISGYL